MRKFSKFCPFYENAVLKLVYILCHLLFNMLPLLSDF